MKNNLQDRTEILNRSGSTGLTCYIPRRDMRLSDNPCVSEYITKSNGMVAVFPQALVLNHRQKVFWSEAVRDFCDNLNSLGVPSVILQNEKTSKDEIQDHKQFTAMLKGCVTKLFDNFPIKRLILDYSPLNNRKALDDLLMSECKSRNITLIRVDAHNVVPVHAIKDYVRSGYAVKQRLIARYADYIGEEYENLYDKSHQKEEMVAGGKEKKTKDGKDGSEQNAKVLCENFMKKNPVKELKFTSNLNISSPMTKYLSGIDKSYKNDLRVLIKKFSLDQYENLLKGTRKDGLTQIDQFIRKKLPVYEKYRNSVDMDVLSGIAPYLNCGIVSSREVIHSVSAKEMILGGNDDEMEGKNKKMKISNPEERETAGASTALSSRSGSSLRSSAFTSVNNSTLATESTDLSAVSTQATESVSEVEETKIKSEKTGEVSFVEGISLVGSSDLTLKDKEKFQKTSQKKVDKLHQPEKSTGKKGKRPLSERIRSNSTALGETDGNILSYLNEVFIWKETADYYVSREKEYDNYGGAPKWAKESLEEHREDERRKVSFESLVLGETDDVEWNAAQKQLIITGKMHGYARMYWAKKLHLWLQPEETVAVAALLNDTFSLDGNDPNGYLGVMWATVGVMDQGFAAQPCMGKVRSQKSLKGSEYLQKWAEIDLRKDKKKKK